jgi:N-ethylmaleimide reductase
MAEFRVLTDLDILFTPFDLFGVRLKNRFVMPAMTRSRCPPDGVPDELNLTYYAQRAGAGLVIGEGTNPMPGGTSFPGVPEIYRPEHVAGWRKVADAVHARGGRMVLQLWHSGRCSHRDWQPDGRLPGGPSAIQAKGGVLMTPTGQLMEPETPRAFEPAEIQGLIDGFAHAARCAVEAGMDGVEIHGANGYLVHQFISDKSNQRADRWGGSIQNRIRFPVEVAEAVAAAVGPERTGIRLSPTATHQDALVSDPETIYPPLLTALGRLGLAYVHCIEGQPGGGSFNDPGDTVFDFKGARRLFPGAWIANNFYDPPKAAAAVRAGDADLVSFGRFFIANPDLPERVRRGAPLNELVTQGLYAGQGAEGYTDYPSLEPEPA